jgi:hypothetical protein
MPSYILRTASSSVVPLKVGGFLEVRRGDLRGAKITDKRIWATQEEWLAEIGEKRICTGQYYGYPKCCIIEFLKVADLRRKDAAKWSELRKAKAQSYDVSNHSGFIPCMAHAKMIYEGKASLASLISNRVCKYPFPEDNMDH